jgi:hypothetical protein
MNKQVIKNSFYLVLMTLISVLIIWVGVMTLMDNYSRDIKNVDKLEGVIEKTEIIRTSKKAGALPSANLKLKFLKIELNNSNERLYTYNPSQEYSELKKKLRKGTEITVYFKKLKETEVINNIFRLDSGQNIILTHEDYKEKEYFAGIVMVLFGLFVLIIGGFMLKKKGLKKNWG